MYVVSLLSHLSKGSLRLVSVLHVGFAPSNTPLISVTALPTLPPAFADVLGVSKQASIIHLMSEIKAALSNSVHRWD